ncbi:MAG: SUMF1/EgtB/PvdO family nonheme iron enzyme, partial [bacterium]
MKRTMVTLLAAVTMLVALSGSARATPIATITIDTVPVRNAGNAAASTGYGTVSYAYNIGKYEVTAGQYKEFLNAVAKTDTYSLYNTNMANGTYGSGITQSGVSGSYTYAVNAAFTNRPVNYVSYWDACRFANWLG